MKEPVQKIIEEFNDYHFHGWQYVPGTLEHLALGLCNEAGELAGVIKKYSRFLKGWKGKKLNVEQFLEKLQDEIPDVLIYLCLITSLYKFDIHNLLIKKLVVLEKRYKKEEV